MRTSRTERASPTTTRPLREGLSCRRGLRQRLRRREPLRRSAPRPPGARERRTRRSRLAPRERALRGDWRASPWSPLAAGPVSAALRDRAPPRRRGRRGRGRRTRRGRDRSSRHPLDLAHESHDVVRRDDAAAWYAALFSSRTVTSGRRCCGRARRYRVTGDREGDSGSEPRRAHASAFGSGTRGCIEPRLVCGARTSRPCEPDRWSTAVESTGRTLRATSAIRRSGTAMMRTSTPLAASEGSSSEADESDHVVAGRDESPGYGLSGPTRTDQANCGHLGTPFCDPALKGCRSLRRQIVSCSRTKYSH